MTKSPVDAVECYRKAAEQGFIEARYALGVCYESGIGVIKNRAESGKWFCKAVEQGFAEAQNSSLKLCYTLSSAIPHYKNPDLLVRRFSEEAENGDAKAKFIIGGCYYTGSRLAKDFAEAVKWWRKAAEQGNANTQFNLGICYAKGQGVTQNFAEASKWYFQAAGQGKTTEWPQPLVQSNAGAQYCLAVCYAGGQGVSRDSAEAVKWFSKAAENGIINAQYNLAVCYAGMEGVVRNDAEAIKWYRNAVAERVKLEHDRIISTLRHRIFIFTEDDIGPAVKKKDFSVFAASLTAALKHWQYLLSIPALLFLLYLMYLLSKRRKIRHASKINLSEETEL